MENVALNGFVSSSSLGASVIVHQRNFNVKAYGSNKIVDNCNRNQDGRKSGFVFDDTDVASKTCGRFYVVRARDSKKGIELLVEIMTFGVLSVMKRYLAFKGSRTRLRGVGLNFCHISVSPNQSSYQSSRKLVI